MTFVPSWPATHIEQLKKYLDDGLSFSQMAKLINDEFGSRYTRNACIGKALRLGLSGRKVKAERITANGQAVIAVRNIARRKKPPQFSPRIGSFISTGGANGGIPIDRDENPAPLRCVETDPLHIAFIDLEKHHCRYPFGGWPTEAPFTFCGRHNDGISSYCAAHHDLARTDPRRPHAEDAATRHRRAAVATGRMTKAAALDPDISLETDEAA